MIVLDTNVLSAVLSERPDRAVVTWLDGRRASSVWLTTITVFEVRFGVELLAQGRRRRRLEAAVERMLDEDFAGRVLVFDDAAAGAAAEISARRRSAGRTVDFRDVQIAGIVASRRGALATGNTRHFTGLGIPLLDPWSPEDR